MKNNGIGITAFAVVIVAIVATLAMIAFSDGIREVDWMDLESTAWACFGLASLGGVLGWCAFRNPYGRLSAILGTIVVAGFFYQLFRSGGPSEPEMPIPANREIEQNAAKDTKQPGR